ncbi:uncharacterized protein C8R40DRAFT_1072717 [Lentinula edodes]|uniref:uncharacterized protein n=1 Tax=Lentinula edodes TaxID=5353 RepID=UPI001E8D84EB|nr:uncharacterized protein C8R40DRAFT_1072717 [Lentinula edodes]KAH7871175.1 hypothetical protein C8R40DRAFT_1072717 [Lentinula edodes]
MSLQMTVIFQLGANNIHPYTPSPPSLGHISDIVNEIFPLLRKRRRLGHVRDDMREFETAKEVHLVLGSKTRDYPFIYFSQDQQYGSFPKQSRFVRDTYRTWKEVEENQYPQNHPIRKAYIFQKNTINLGEPMYFLVDRPLLTLRSKSPPMALSAAWVSVCG